MTLLSRLLIEPTTPKALYTSSGIDLFARDGSQKLVEFDQELHDNLNHIRVFTAERLDLSHVSVTGITNLDNSSEVPREMVLVGLRLLVEVRGLSVLCATAQHHLLQPLAEKDSFSFGELISVTRP